MMFLLLLSQRHLNTTNENNYIHYNKHRLICDDVREKRLKSYITIELIFCLTNKMFIM